MLPELIRRGGAGLGGDEEVSAHIGQRHADLFLAVGIGVGGVEEVDAAVIGAAEQARGLLLGKALHGQRTETGARGMNPS